MNILILLACPTLVLLPAFAAHVLVRWRESEAGGWRALVARSPFGFPVLVLSALGSFFLALALIRAAGRHVDHLPVAIGLATMLSYGLSTYWVLRLLWRPIGKPDARKTSLMRGYVLRWCSSMAGCIAAGLVLEGVLRTVPQVSPHARTFAVLLTAGAAIFLMAVLSPRAYLHAMESVRLEGAALTKILPAKWRGGRRTPDVWAVALKDPAGHGIFNAWSIGLARSRPKLVATTAFLDEFPDEEIRAIMAHELAHARCSHPLKQLLVLELLLAAAATVAIALSGAWPGFEIPVALILFVAFGMPGVTWVMRRAEFTADSMAAQETGCAEALGAALQRLESKNPKPKAASGWMSALYRTHPRTDERLQRLRLLETPAP